MNRLTDSTQHDLNTVVLFIKKSVSSHNRKVPVLPQSQNAANPRRQEEEKDKNQCMQNEQMQEKHIDKFSLPPRQARWSQCLKD